MNKPIVVVATVVITAMTILNIMTLRLFDNLYHLYFKAFILLVNGFSIGVFFCTIMMGEDENEVRFCLALKQSNSRLTYLRLIGK